MKLGKLTMGTGFTKGVVAGTVIGLLVGSAGLSLAGFGKKGWDRFGLMFKHGYVAGFNDCVRIGKSTNPHSQIAMLYVLPDSAKGDHWVKEIDKFYANPKFAGRPMSQIMILAGKELEKTFGVEKGITGANAFEILRRIDESRRKAAIERRKAEAESASAGEKEPEDGEKEPEDGEKKPAAGDDSK